MTTYVGIDPGKKGALVAVDEAGAVLAASRTPLFRGSFDPRAATELFDALRRAHGPLVVCIEKAQATGRSSRFADSGYLAVRTNIRAWQEAAGRRMAWLPVAARTWQAAVIGRFAKGASKAASVAWCELNAPDLDLYPGRCATPHDGISDARCIAEYARKLPIVPLS